MNESVKADWEKMERSGHRHLRVPPRTRECLWLPAPSPMACDEGSGHRKTIGLCGPAVLPNQMCDTRLHSLPKVDNLQTDLAKVIGADLDIWWNADKETIPGAA